MSNRKIQIENLAFEKFRRFCFWTTDPNNLHDHGTMLLLPLLTVISSPPRRWSKFRKAPDQEIGKPGENRRKIVADRYFQPAAAFHDRQNRCNLQSCQWTADVYPILPVMKVLA